MNHRQISLLQHTKNHASKFLQLFCVFAITVASTLAYAGNLRIDSWRTDDQALWNEHILPVFHASHPNIKVSFVAVNPIHYDTVLNERLLDKTAGDLIACRPFAPSLKLFKNGDFVDLTQRINLKAFRTITKVAWTTPDGNSTYCLPLASVTNGFFYNKQIFEELNLRVPETEEQLLKVLESLLGSKKYIPIAFGTEDRWESAQVALASVGPNEWKGEIGRRALIEQTIKFTDAPFVRAFEKLVQLKPYLSPDHANLNYDQARNLFTTGKAATYLSGSWGAAYLERLDPDKYGVFKYPAKKINDDCYVTNHMDMGIGINTASNNQSDALIFMKWLSTKEFAEAFANAISGFMPLSSHAILIQSPLANEIYQWRKECKSTIRINSQYLDDGPQPIEQLLWEVSASVINHTMTPIEATRVINQSLDRWFYTK